MKKKESLKTAPDEKKVKSGTDILKEEAILSPGRMIVRAFLHNRLGMIGLIGFIIIFLIIFVGSSLIPFDAYFTNGVMRNVRPGYGYMSIPKEMLEEGIKDISVSTTTAMGISQAGKFYTWGHDNIGNLEMPEKIQKAIEGQKIDQVAAGDRHMLLLTEDDQVFGWGANEFHQCEMPKDKQKLVEKEGLAKIGAGDAYSVGLTDEGTIFVWGSTLPNRLNRIPANLNGQVKDFRTGAINIMLLLKDGSLRIIGSKGSEIDTAMPKHLLKPGNDIVSFARTQYSGVVAYGDGSIEAWGSRNENAVNFPEMEGKVIEVGAGRLHLSALTDQGRVYSWGPDTYDSTHAPQMDDAEKLFCGYYNNYAVENGGHSYKAWGLNGMILGSDDTGRDLFVRLIYGGRMTLMIAFVSVLISIVLGIIVGLISGFYGGWIDNLLMRFSEIIASFPFYPLVITLAAILPADYSQYKRLAMVMVLLGVLGWTGTARLIRGQIIAEREKDYITAAKALGLHDKKIIISHILPNVMSIIIVNLTLGYATNLLVEAGLSFLGFGVVEPLPSWGNMMTSAQSSDVMQIYWWRWIFPGLAVFLTALTVNLIGDALRDCMDPKALER